MWEWPKTTAAASGKRARSRSSRPVAGPASWTTPSSAPPAVRPAGSRGPARRSAASAFPATATTPEPRAAGGGAGGPGGRGARLGALDFPGDRHDRRPQRLDLGEYRGGAEVAGVDDQVGGAELLDTAVRESPLSARHVSVCDQRDP